MEIITEMLTITTIIKKIALILYMKVNAHNQSVLILSIKMH